MCSLSTKQINPPSAIDNSVCCQTTTKPPTRKFGLEAIRCVSKVSGKATVIAAIGVRYTKKYADGGYTISGMLVCKILCPNMFLQWGTFIRPFTSFYWKVAMHVRSN
ncbi:hypothetical protein AAZX31_20G211800 [Glycine max]